MRNPSPMKLRTSICRSSTPHDWTWPGHLQLAVGQTCTRNCKKNDAWSLLSGKHSGAAIIAISTRCRNLIVLFWPCRRFYNLHILLAYIQLPITAGFLRWSSCQNPETAMKHQRWFLVQNVSRKKNMAILDSKGIFWVFPPMLFQKTSILLSYAHSAYINDSHVRKDLYMKVYSSESTLWILLKIFPAQAIQVTRCHLRNEYRRWETASRQVCYSQHYSLDIVGTGPKSGTSYFDGQSQLMVWLGGLGGWWFGFLGSPKMKGIVT